MNDKIQINKVPDPNTLLKVILGLLRECAITPDREMHAMLELIILQHSEPEVLEHWNIGIPFEQKKWVGSEYARRVMDMYDTKNTYEDHVKFIDELRLIPLAKIIGSSQEMSKMVLDSMKDTVKNHPNWNNLLFEKGASRFPKPLTLYIDPGDASIDEITELYHSLNDLYRHFGGTKLKFTSEGCKVVADNLEMA